MYWAQKLRNFLGGPPHWSFGVVEPCEVQNGLGDLLLMGGQEFCPNRATTVLLDCTVNCDGAHAMVPTLTMATAQLSSFFLLAPWLWSELTFFAAAPCCYPVQIEHGRKLQGCSLVEIFVTQMGQKWPVIMILQYLISGVVAMANLLLIFMMVRGFCCILLRHML